MYNIIMCVIIIVRCDCASNKTEKTAITRRLGRASVTGPDAGDYDTTAIHDGMYLPVWSHNNNNIRDVHTHALPSHAKRAVPSSHAYVCTMANAQRHNNGKQFFSLLFIIFPAPLAVPLISSTRCTYYLHYINNNNNNMRVPAAAHNITVK